MYPTHVRITASVHNTCSSCISTSHALHLYFTCCFTQLHNDVTCTSFYFTCTSQQLHSNITALDLYLMVASLTQLHTYFTCTSLLLHLHFTKSVYTICRFFLGNTHYRQPLHNHWKLVDTRSPVTYTRARAYVHAQTKKSKKRDKVPASGLSLC